MPLAGYYHNELEKVDKASKRLREVMDGLSPAFFIGMLNLEGCVTYANQTALDAVGIERKDVLGRKFDETPWWAHSESQRIQLRSAIYKALQGESSRFDMQFRDINQQLRIIDFSIHPVFDVKNNVSYLVPSGHDVTERRRAERSLSMITECQALLLQVDEEQRLLQNICQLIMDRGGYPHVWIGSAQQDERKTILPVAYVGIEAADFKDYLSWSADDIRGQGLTGPCIRQSKTILCQDFLQVESLAVQQMATSRGIRGGIALALKDHLGNAFGVLSIVSHEVFDIEQEEVLLLEKLADSISYGIRNLRARKENEQSLAVIYQIADVVSLATGDHFFQKLTLAMTKTLGAEVGFISRVQLDKPSLTRSVALVVDGNLLDNIDIPIIGTPCERLSPTAKEWIVSCNVIEQYPLAEGLRMFGAESYIGRRIENLQGEYTGQIVLLFRRPLLDTALISAVFNVFAARVAAEFERIGQEDDHVYKI